MFKVYLLLFQILCILRYKNKYFENDKFEYNTSLLKPKLFVELQICKKKKVKTNKQ